MANDPQTTNQSGTHTYDPRTHEHCVLAERERCVKIVESFVKLYWFNPDMPEDVAEIVAAIRGES